MVVTPAAVAALPSIRRRLAAMVYEALLLGGIIVVAVFVPLTVLKGITGVLLSAPLMRAYVFLLLAAYFLWHWQPGKQTLAQRTWKLVIRSSDGSVPTLRQLALRYVLAWPSVLLFGAGILWALVDRERQFLHDRLAGTRIEFAG